MKRGLSSLLAAWAVTALLGLAVEPTAGLAAGSSSRAERPSAQMTHSSRSHRTRLSGRRRTGVVPAAPGEGYGSPSGSADVRALQRLLARGGDRPGPIDGRYGALTEQAVRRFQAAHGLRVDGIAGPRMLAALTASTLVLYPGAGSEPGGSQCVTARGPTPRSAARLRTRRPSAHAMRRAQLRSDGSYSSACSAWDC